MPAAIGDGRLHVRRAGEVLHEAREPLHVLEDIKRRQGSATFQAQYQQTPIPDTGNLVKRDWFKFYDVAPIRQPGDRIVQSWDTAMKGAEHNDHSVCMTFLIRNELYRLLDVVRQHCE